MTKSTTLYNQLMDVPYNVSLPYDMLGINPDVIQSLYTSAGKGMIVVFFGWLVLITTEKFSFEPPGAVYVPQGIGSLQTTEQQTIRTNINMSIIYTDYLDVIFSQALVCVRMMYGY